MKKGLLLSVAATAVIFAGGDIAPVEPEVAPAPATADFWGQIGVRYDANDYSGSLIPKGANTDFGDKENNGFSTAIVLGVEKQIGAGFGFGAEVAGWTDFGLDIADNVAVDREISFADQTDAEISQAYITYSFGNTAIKAGRQALPKAVSPWAWSDRSVGVIDISYDAVVLVNTDLTDTTLVGAWVANAANADNTIHLGDDHEGVFMLAMINKSLANTTLAVSGYYEPSSIFTPAFDDVWSVWASSMTQWDTFHWGLQGAYVDGDVSGADATYGVAGKIGSSWGDFSAELTAAYINDGDYSLKTAGSGAGTSAFWGNSFGGFFTNGDITGYIDKTTGKFVTDDQSIIRVDASYQLGFGKLYGGVGYVAYGDNALFDDGVGARIGYKFTVAGVNTNVEYRYADYSDNGAGDLTKQRIRVEAYYKF